MRDRGCNSYSEATRLTGSFTVHELLETITDPFGKAWQYREGLEIGDKCVWRYPETCVTLPGGERFQLQSFYSNAVHSCVP